MRTLPGHDSDRKQLHFFRDLYAGGGGIAKHNADDPEQRSPGNDAASGVWRGIDFTAWRISAIGAQLRQLRDWRAMPCTDNHPAQWRTEQSRDFRGKRERELCD